MFADKVIQTLTESDKNILFYFDTDGSKKEELTAIEEAGIKVIEVTQNYFELKYKLEMEWNAVKVLLYHPFAKPEGKKAKKYPLLDLLAANIELKLDEVSEFMAAYKLQEYHTNVVSTYFKLLKTKSTQKKLARILDPENFNEDNLKRGILSIVLDLNSVEDRFNCMNKWLSLSLDETKFNKTNATLKELELDTLLITWFNNLLDSKEENLAIESATNWITKLKYNIIVANVTKAKATDTYTSLKIKRAADSYKLLKFFEEWQKNQATNKNIDHIFSTLGNKVNALAILNWYGSTTEYGYYSEEMLDAILKMLYSEVGTNALKTKEECIRWRKEEAISEYIKNQINFLYHAAAMYAILESYKSFRFNTAEAYINEYTTELHKVDYNYRKAVITFDNVRDHLEEFEHTALPVFEALNVSARASTYFMS